MQLLALGSSRKTELITAAAVVLLLTGYTRVILGVGHRALVFGAGLTAAYGLVYVILKEERFALLTGAWTLFLLLALTMYLTRRVDWFNLGRSHGKT